MLRRLYHAYQWFKTWSTDPQLEYLPPQRPRVLASFRARLMCKQTGQLAFRFNSALVDAAIPSGYQWNLFDASTVGRLYGTGFLLVRVEWIDYMPELEVVELE